MKINRSKRQRKRPTSGWCDSKMMKTKFSICQSGRRHLHHAKMEFSEADRRRFLPLQVLAQSALQPDKSL